MEEQGGNHVTVEVVGVWANWIKEWLMIDVTTKPETILSNATVSVNPAS